MAKLLKPGMHSLTPPAGLVMGEGLIPPPNADRPSGGHGDMGYPPGFVARLDAAIRLATLDQSPGVLLTIMIDNLAMIVSGYGHAIAESVMNELREKIQEMIGATHSVERIQRDEFGVIIADLDESELHGLTERIRSHIQLYSCYSEYGSLHVMTSVASVRFPDRCSNAHEALDQAFIALSDTSGLRIIEPRDENDASNHRQQMGLANYLSKALQEHRLKLAYQPIISAKDGSVAHYEALLRLHGADGTISSAGALIPVAERMGLIDVIDELTMRMVIEELNQSPDVTIAFNVSNLTTRNTRWLRQLGDLLNESAAGVAQRLIVEITETAAQRDMRRTAYFVAAVQSHGAQVALDDFGSGYTSFRQLKMLSVDMVKIDGAFIKDLVDNHDSRFFVKTLLDFTNGFGLPAVAEFVETGEVAKMLMELGAQYLQGYYFGRPENRRVWRQDGEYKK